MEFTATNLSLPHARQVTRICMRDVVTEGKRCVFLCCESKSMNSRKPPGTSLGNSGLGGRSVPILLARASALQDVQRPVHVLFLSAALTTATRLILLFPQSGQVILIIRSRFPRFLGRSRKCCDSKSTSLRNPSGTSAGSKGLSRCLRKRFDRCLLHAGQRPLHVPFLSAVLMRVTSVRLCSPQLGQVTFMCKRLPCPSRNSRECWDSKSTSSRNSFGTSSGKSGLRPGIIPLDGSILPCDRRWYNQAKEKLPLWKQTPPSTPLDFFAPCPS